MKKSQARILIVDDENIARKVLSRVLTGAGFYVSESGSAPAALTRLETLKFEVVTADLKMPVMSGLEMLKVIKLLYPDTAVIMVTAVDDLSTAVECMQKGADDYIVKPFDLKTVPDTIRKALQKREENIARKEHLHEVEYKLRHLSQHHEAEKEKFLKSFAQQVACPLSEVVDSSEQLADAMQSTGNQQVRALAGNIKRKAWALNNSLAHIDRHKDKPG